MERCEMERITDMKTFLQERKEFLLKERIKKLKSTLTYEESKELESILKELVSEGEGGRLLIVYLRSSYITGSHNFYIAFYTGEPFVEEEPDNVVYSMQEIFQSVEDDWVDMQKKLQEKFIRIMDSEKEEIRRWYMEELYRCAGILFKEWLEDMKSEKNTEVYYGSYMDEVEWIGYV